VSFYVSTATFFLLHCDEWGRVVALPRHKFVTGATLLQLGYTRYLEYLFGKHDVDMFALDSNAMVDYNGVTLEHFTPMSSPFSAGIDAFSQCYVDEKNILHPCHLTFQPVLMLLVNVM